MLSRPIILITKQIQLQDFCSGTNLVGPENSISNILAVYSIPQRYPKLYDGLLYILTVRNRLLLEFQLNNLLFNPAVSPSCKSPRNVEVILHFHFLLVINLLSVMQRIS